MKIVVLDGYTLNPGDLTWSGLEALGDVTVYARTPAEQIVKRAQGAEIVLTNKALLTENCLAKLPSLKYIGVLATGYNVVDIHAAAQRGIPVTNIPTYGTASVAQFVFALLLELCHRIQTHDHAVKQGEWSNCSDWCFTKTPLMELEGKTMGIIGYGRIGQRVAQIAIAMGMNVLASTHSSNASSLVQGVQFASNDEVLQQSDVISLHCPLTPSTSGLINRKAILMMKRDAIVINTSRGSLIVDQDLADALNEGRLAGAALDVLSVEPPHPSNPLLSANNCMITPHIAWATKEARARLMDIAVANVAAFLKGNPTHVVNKVSGDSQ